MMGRLERNDTGMVYVDLDCYFVGFHDLGKCIFGRDVEVGVVGSLEVQIGGGGRGNRLEWNEVERKG